MKLEEQHFFQARKTFWNISDGIAISSRGASGGLGTLWNPNKIELIHSHTSSHWILTVLFHKDTDLQVILLNIYAPVLHAEKKVCWNSIQEHFHLLHLENIIIVGDLNLTLNAEEKKGDLPSRTPLEKSLMI